jgi:hypothetical protein
MTCCECDNELNFDTRNQTRYNCTLLTPVKVNVFNASWDFTGVSSIQL